MQFIRLASFAVALLASASIVAGSALEKRRPACDYDGDGQAWCENFCGSTAAICGESSIFIIKPLASRLKVHVDPGNTCYCY